LNALGGDFAMTCGPRAAPTRISASSRLESSTKEIDDQEQGGKAQTLGGRVSRRRNDLSPADLPRSCPTLHFWLSLQTKQRFQTSLTVCYPSLFEFGSPDYHHILNKDLAISELSKGPSVRQ